jgi:hypothetical protein
VSDFTKVYVKPDSFVGDVKYHCDLDDPLYTEETNFKKHKTECSYVCDVRKKVKNVGGLSRNFL